MLRLPSSGMLFQYKFMWSFAGLGQKSQVTGVLISAIHFENTSDDHTLLSRCVLPNFKPCESAKLI
jgi:hypothetical protein